MSKEGGVPDVPRRGQGLSSGLGKAEVTLGGVTDPGNSLSTPPQTNAHVAPEKFSHRSSPQGLQRPSKTVGGKPRASGP